MSDHAHADGGRRLPLSHALHRLGTALCSTWVQGGGGHCRGTAPGRCVAPNASWWRFLTRHTVQQIRMATAARRSSGWRLQPTRQRDWCRSTLYLRQRCCGRREMSCVRRSRILWLGAADWHFWIVRRRWKRCHGWWSSWAGKSAGVGGVGGGRRRGLDSSCKRLAVMPPKRLPSRHHHRVVGYCVCIRCLGLCATYWVTTRCI